MNKFTVSAPGQICLFGEQGIIHGQRAIHASLNFRTWLKFTELPQKKKIIRIECPSVNISITLPLQTFKNSFFGEYTFDGDTDQLLDKVQNFINKQIIHYNEHEYIYLVSWIYFLVYIAYKEQMNIKSFHVYLTTEISKNLGVRGSVIVCFVACYFHWSRVQKGIHIRTFNNDVLNKILEYATTWRQIANNFLFVNEIIVSIYGAMVLCQIGKPMEVIRKSRTAILLVASNKVQSFENLFLQTKIKQMEDLEQSYPTIIDSILNGLNAILKTAFEMLFYTTISSRDSIEENTNSQQQMQIEIELQLQMQIENQQFVYLIQMHQELMNMFDTLNSDLDIICSTARRYGLSAKNADIAGRYVYIWCKLDTPHTLIMLLSQDLIAKGFNVLDAYLYDGGVNIE